MKKKEFSIDVEKNFEPDYEIPEDKKTLVKTLKSEAKEADTVWLASDEDREGEAIAWHLYEVLKLNPEHTKRIVFHEITKTAILKAIEQPRNIDINLVNAQQARRILDRIVGFELSPVLWKKMCIRDRYIRRQSNAAIKTPVFPLYLVSILYPVITAYQFYIYEITACVRNMRYGIYQIAFPINSFTGGIIGLIQVQIKLLLRILA